ncbi:IS21 family transposase [Calderihabitans maritimus]|uniref:Transposase subunit n=1 Tax=Calderihabitans maritimus TaxID=1246530 RepID=A0A1Z5HS07_9FIRM|nr:IS21 family transposase [Calderihabitans maritimus]GAW92111.1 transposase subunit [Calderihabitans maritimus]
MRNIKEILKLKWEQGLSNRKIARSIKASPTTVKDILVRAEKANLSWPLPEELDDEKLEALLYPAVVKTKGCRPEPDYEYIHRELRKKGVTLQLLWLEYKEQHPDGLQYSQFCYKYQKWREKLDVSMRQTHKAGEKVFVDWAGQTFPIVNPKTGEAQDTFIFVAVLGASNYTYAEAFLSQELSHWIAAHCRAFEYFNGVPEIVVPDNLRTGVSRACYYEPEINPTYQEMASHYGTVVIPTRSRKPKDKAKVENAVLVVERWIMAALRKHTFFSLDELNRAIFSKLEELNQKPFQKLEGCRKELFETLDRPALKPLPAKRYEFAEWKKVRVNIDSHIEFDKNFYSVPHQLLKEQVEVRATASTVEIFYKGQRVASHQRVYGKGRHQTEPKHLPRAHQKYLEWTPSRLIHWSETIGPNTAELVKKILESRPHPEQGYRSCLGIMRLSKAYPKERMEAAAKRALTIGATSYRSLKSILEKGLDRLELTPPVNSNTIHHENIRGAGYYSKKGGSF